MTLNSASDYPQGPGERCKEIPYNDFPAFASEVYKDISGRSISRRPDLRSEPPGHFLRVSLKVLEVPSGILIQPREYEEPAATKYRLVLQFLVMKMTF